MDTATQTLVIINSIVLIIFLVLATVALFKIIHLVDELKTLADKAERVADSVEQATDAFKKTAGPLAAVKFISNMVRQAQKARGKD